jgi:hypothetical protein
MEGAFMLFVTIHLQNQNTQCDLKMACNIQEKPKDEQRGPYIPPFPSKMSTSLFELHNG